MIRRPTYYLILALSLAFLARPAAAGVMLLSSDANSAVVEYRCAGPAFGTAAPDYRTLQLEDCQIDGAPGQPGLPRCLVRLAVPEGAQVSVEVLGAVTRDYSDVKLAPVPTLALDRDGIDQQVYRADAAAYAGAALVPQSQARVAAVEPLRQLMAAVVALQPAQYAPAKGLLRVCTELRVRVAWSGGTKADGTVNDPGFEPLLRQLVLNFDDARSWARPQPPPAKGTDPFAAAPVWYKLAVAQDGIYKLSYNDLKLNGIDPAIIDPRTIKVFTGGSRAFPKRYSGQYPDSMYQIALTVQGESDGAFDPGDYVLFYGRGMNGWEQNQALPKHQYNNPYDSVNCYWLCWGGGDGLRMAVRSGEPGAAPAPVPADFPDTLHFEQDAVNPFNSGEQWYWQTISRFTNETTKTAEFSYVVPAVGSPTATAKVSLRSGTLSTLHHLQWGLNGGIKDFSWSDSWYNPDGDVKGTFTDSASFGTLQAGTNVMRCTLVKAGADSADEALLDWFEIAYRRPYQACNRQLKFRADTSYGGTVRFHLTGLASPQAEILDITDPDRPVRITTSRLYPAYCEFDGAGRRTYYAAAAEVWRTPLAVSGYVPQHLRQSMLNTAFLLVAADELWPQAQELLRYHGTKPSQQPARAVRLSAIYNEFGFGLRDPSALRNFLKYVFLNSSPARTYPVWCCLLGDGSYDYRGIDRSALGHNLIPCHQEDQLNYVLKEYLYSSNEDWFANCDTFSSPQFALARIPARTAAEAAAAVAKAISYDAGQTLGPWRNRFLLMADDLVTPTSSTETEHTTDSEDLSRSFIPQACDQIKVYGVMREYPLSSQNIKQGAHDDLVRYWDDGVGVVNFIGHGAWWIWGHESYFRDTDVPNLSNGDRLPLVVMCSCGTSRFDNPHNEAIGSALVTRSGGGAIATIGAMRETYSGDNTVVAKKFYRAAYDSGLDIGRSFWLAKQNAGLGNNVSFALLGDPGIALGNAKGRISLALDSDTLRSRGRYLVRGTVAGTGAPSGGQVQVTLFDITTTDSADTYHSLKFIRPGKQLFRGLATVAGDSFRAWFTVPDLLHSAPLAGARISAYAWDGSGDAAGATSGTIWIGTDTARVMGDTTDRRGPSIAVFASGLALAEGDTVDAQADLTLKIADRSGINIAPGVPEGEVRVKFDNGSATDYSQGFLYDLNSDTSGQATVTAKLTEGAHRIRVEAYDCMRNKTLWERNVTVASLQLKVEQAYNYPNPTAGATTFTFQIRQPADVTIGIYTVAGRRIRTVSAPSLPAGYNQVPWDGRDDDGDIPANGVYLYKVTMKNGNGENSVYSKLVIMR
ncbi:MAG TPA: type IX secretion system sortase PorU [Candidatus Edwardsbacteria bacterium]|nr:type IX secretion system sortase PorU [Candidatus Edwardsbacteria bacterium]